MAQHPQPFRASNPPGNTRGIRVLLTWLLVSLCCLTSAFAGTLVQFRTAFGDIELELYDADKPITVQNFLRYVKSGAFQNGFAHRLVPGFVLQGGGYTVSNRGTTNSAIVSIPTYGSIPNEFGVGRRFSNVYGTIAMAKLAGNTNSATSQWFINLANNTALDASDTNNLFVVFGHVISGTNVLNAFNRFQYWTGPAANNVVVHQVYNPPFDDLPLLYFNSPNYLSDSYFVYVDASVHSQQFTLTNKLPQFSWNSISGMTNILEYTTGLPPVWKPLTNFLGDGTQAAYRDTTATNGLRFYRVRVQ